MSLGVRNEAGLCIIWGKDDWTAGMRGGQFAMTKEPSKVKDSAYYLRRGGGWSKVLMLWQGKKTRSAEVVDEEENLARGMRQEEMARVFV